MLRKTFYEVVVNQSKVLDAPLNSIFYPHFFLLLFPTDQHAKPSFLHFLLPFFQHQYHFFPPPINPVNSYTPEKQAQPNTKKLPPPSQSIF